VTPVEVFRATLPERPYHTDELWLGLKIADAARAVRSRYIQPNDANNLRWLPVDVDQSDAGIRYLDTRSAPPNIIAINRENGHAHYLYGLEVPVWRNHETARKTPVRFAAAIQIGLTRQLQADPAYSGLITKNPCRHDAWTIVQPRFESYDLNELADWTDLSGLTDYRRRLPEIGLGRNVELFDTVRFWAYRHIREGWLSYDYWLGAVFEYAGSQNLFAAPLPISELSSISKSVAKYTWQNMSPQGFREWSENRRRRSAIVRGRRSQERAQEARTLRAEGWKLQDIADQIGISKSRVSRLIRGVA
jgi:AraC-like DNA-binding protein